ncbi:MAG: SRPBCC family protein [Candidatus Angelobacter sp.]
MNEAASIHLENAESSHTGSIALKRGVLIGGGALTLLGLARRSKSGVAIAAAGGLLAYLAARSDAQRELIARSSVLLNCSPAEGYQFWRNFENLPLFMRHLESVRILGDYRSRWIAIGPFGKHIRWDAEIAADRENELIAWRSLPDSDVTVDGVVKFRPAPANRGTLVDVVVVYRTPAGTIGNAVAKMLGKDPNFMMRQDLRRFKAFIEAGEIPTVEGQTHGPRSGVAAIARVLDPDEPTRGDATLTEPLGARRRVS